MKKCPSLLTRVVLIGVCVAAGAAGCMPGNVLVVGPIRVTAMLGSGSLAPSLFSAKALTTVTVDQDFCDMPSEQDLSDQVLQVGQYDLSKFVKLSALHLVDLTLTASQGDFNFVKELTVSYVPAAGAEGSTDPVVLGTASNANGLGTDVTLTPPGDVDVLQLIRQNDANTAGTCPKLRFEMTLSSAPTGNVSYDIGMTVDAYAQVGKF